MKWRSITALGGEYGRKYTNISLVYQHGSRSHKLGRVYGYNQLRHSTGTAAPIKAATDGKLMIAPHR